MDILNKPIPLELFEQCGMESFAPSGDIVSLNDDVLMSSLKEVSDSLVSHYLFLIEERGYKWHITSGASDRVEITYFRELTEDVSKALALRGRALSFEDPPLSINEHMHLGKMFGLDSDYLSKFKARFSSLLAEDEPTYECVVQITPKLSKEKLAELQVKAIDAQETFYTMQVLASSSEIKERLLEYLKSEYHTAVIIREDESAPFEKSLDEIEFKGSPEWFKDKEELTLQRPGQQRHIPKTQPQVEYPKPDSEAMGNLFIDGIVSRLPEEANLITDPRYGLYIAHQDDQGRRATMVWIHTNGEISIFETEFRDFPDSLSRLMDYFSDQGITRVGEDQWGGSLWTPRRGDTEPMAGAM